jgi:UDP-glucose 4-epimerase
MKILVTGATGFIGSHFCVHAIEQGLDLVLLDNFENSSIKVLAAIEKLTGKKVVFEQADVRSEQDLTTIFTKYPIDAVVHFAGYKAVGESASNPLMYYQNNISGSVNLLQIMKQFNVKKIVFSSSATVYGEPQFNPYTEQHPKAPINPYGNTKSMFEDVLQDLCNSDSAWSAIPLRYFNPIGAHPSGEIGEDPKGIPNNLMPFITKVAVGQLAILNVFGNDYDTPDGTGVRDYIHVMDLAIGHVKALRYLMSNTGYQPINLGAGNGYSVLDIISAFESENEVKINYQFSPRRDGDLAAYWADASLAKQLLGWETQLTIDEMVRDSWAWQSKYPNGFE